jgi:uncharacterized membrane protein
MQRLDAFDWLTLSAALGSGLAAGFFFAFSICVMQALERIAVPHGIGAMQSINVVVINPWFMTVFLGTAVSCAAAIVVAVLHWQDAAAPYWLVGAIAYLAGTLLVTMVFNVPRNNALAALALASSEGAAYWRDYLTSWTRWNHVRTISSLVAAASFIYALRLRA